PSTESAVDPTNEATSTMADQRGSRNPQAIATAHTRDAATNPANVPSQETAPLVPAATGRSEVIRTGRPPYARPISLLTVSNAAVAYAQTNAMVKISGVVAEARRNARYTATPQLASACRAER